MYVLNYFINKTVKQHVAIEQHSLPTVKSIIQHQGTVLNLSAVCIHRNIVADTVLLSSNPELKYYPLITSTEIYK